MPPDLAPLLRPLERFEEIRRRVVVLGDRLCDLSYGNPYAGAEEATRAVLREALDARRLLDLQYSPVGGHTIPRRAVADRLVETHGLPFKFGDVLLTPGATAALQVALRAAGVPGDEVIVPVPCWLDYPLYARHLGLTPVLVPLAEGTFELDGRAIADAVTPRTCAVLLSHPANPTGRCYGASELETLREALEHAQGAAGRPITLIADEVHRDFLPPGTYRTAAATWLRTLITYSFGKYHFLQGQRLGYVAVCPQHPQRGEVSGELARWIRIMGYMGPTALMQRAVPGLLGLRHDFAPMQDWRTRYSAELSAAGYDVVPGDGTFFLYVRTPGRDGAPASDDFAFVEQLARSGILALPAPVFHHRGYFRLSLTGANAMLERALATLSLSPASCPSYA